jgi:hypothetical protein
MRSGQEKTEPNPAIIAEWGEKRKDRVYVTGNRE